MRRILGSLYFSVICGLFGYFLAEYFNWSTAIKGLVCTSAAIIAFALSSLKSWLEIKKLVHEVDLKKRRTEEGPIESLLAAKGGHRPARAAVRNRGSRGEEVAGTRTYSSTDPPVHR